MGDKHKGGVAPPKLVVTNIDKDDEKYRVEVDKDVVSKIRNVFSKEPIAFFVPGDDGIDDGFTMDKLHEKLPNGGSCKVRFGDKGKKDKDKGVKRDRERLKNIVYYLIYGDREVYQQFLPSCYTLKQQLSWYDTKVFSAFDENCRMYVVVKIATSSSQLSQEYQVLQTKLKQCDGVPCVRWYSNNSDHTILVETPLGRTIDTRFNAVSPVDQLGVLCDWGVRLVDLLVCIHKQGVIHRDIKPSNIIVDMWGDCCFIDFGLAVVLPLKGDEPYAGTKLFASNNQLSGLAPCFNDDFESLCYTLYALEVGVETFINLQQRPLLSFIQKTSCVVKQVTKQWLKHL